MNAPREEMDKTAFSVTSFSEAEQEDHAYWHSKTPQERLEALEQMRQIGYGYDPVADEMERVPEVVDRSGSARCLFPPE